MSPKEFHGLILTELSSLIVSIPHCSYLRVLLMRSIICHAALQLLIFLIVLLWFQYIQLIIAIIHENSYF